MFIIPYKSEDFKRNSQKNNDMNFAILTSKASFSSGNFMPCIAQEKGIAILGETSGGGTDAPPATGYAGTTVAAAILLFGAAGIAVAGRKED